MKGPIRRAVEATPAFPQLEARAQFQDGYPLFIASEESLKDLQGYVSVSASGKDEKWRVGKIDKEAWKDGERLKMERYVLFVSKVARLRFGADHPPLAFVLLSLSGASPANKLLSHPVFLLPNSICSLSNAFLADFFFCSFSLLLNSDHIPYSLFARIERSTVSLALRNLGISDSTSIAFLASVFGLDGNDS